MAHQRAHDMTPLDYAYFEGDIIPFADARVSIGTHALQYGTGAFAGVRAYRADDGNAVNIFRLDAHTARLFHSAKMLRMNLPIDQPTFMQTMVELLRTNRPTTDSYFRPFVYKSSVALSPSLQPLDDDLAIYMVPMGDYMDLSHGQRAIVTSWARASDNMIPSRGKFTGSYINAAFAKDQATWAGANDAIMLDAQGKVSEGSSCNIFIVRDGTLITTPVTSSILEGITRRSVLQIAQELGIPVETRPVDRSELYIADEAMFCGTAIQVAWIEEIDGRTIGDGTQGPIARALHDAMFDIFRGRSDAHQDWITRVEL